jgi:hypothetical protein
LRKILLASVLLVEVLTGWPAEASQWWTLDPSETRGCFVGEISPDEFVQAAQASSSYDGPPQLDVERGGDGNVAAVIVTTSKHGAKASVLWTTTWLLCDQMKRDFMKRGTIIARPDDLR